MKMKEMGCGSSVEPRRNSSGTDRDTQACAGRHYSLGSEGIVREEPSQLKVSFDQQWRHLKHRFSEQFVNDEVINVDGDVNTQLFLESVRSKVAAWIDSVQKDDLTIYLEVLKCTDVPLMPQPPSKGGRTSLRIGSIFSRSRTSLTSASLSPYAGPLQVVKRAAMQQLDAPIDHIDEILLSNAKVYG